VSASVIIPAALFFAAVLHSRVPGSGIYKALFLFPNIMPIVARAILWRAIYNTNHGILTGALTSAHLPGLTHAWLTDPKTALLAVIGANVWYSAGFYIVLFLAGMQNIPKDLYEVATIDGASAWHSFRHVTIRLATGQNTNLGASMMAIRLPRVEGESENMAE
jgi:ABC-type sugar transport system permease subunit